MVLNEYHSCIPYFLYLTPPPVEEFIKRIFSKVSIPISTAPEITLEERVVSTVIKAKQGATGVDGNGEVRWVQKGNSTKIK